MLHLPILALLVTGVVSQDSVVPIHYDLTIIPNYSAFNFSSETKITILLERPQTSLTLNSRSLEVTEVEVISHATNEAVPGVRHTGGVTEDVLLEFDELNEGLYDVSLKTSGTINDEQKGLYHSEFTRGDELRTIFLADFRYDKARGVFPCFDDPRYVSTFTLSIVRPPTYKAVAGTPLASSSNLDATTVKDIFVRTGPIPTYLLSFAVSNFTEKNSVYSFVESGTEFLAKFSTDALIAFKQLYPTRANDLRHVVVPDSVIREDVLENNGLIIYRESVVLYDEQLETVEDKQEIAKVVVHAVVSQAEDISFTWETKFWASVGVTNVYTYEVLLALQPTWRLDEQFLVNELRDLLWNDVGDTAISVILSTGQTPDAFTQFQSLKSYELVRMFLRLPTPGDILADDSNSIAVAWTQNKGYPTMRTTRISNNQISFLPSDNFRPVPIKVAFENQPQNFQHFDVVIESANPYINFSGDALGSWYLVSPERLGYYRVNYDVTNWRSLSQFLLSSRNDIATITAPSRAVLIDDSAYFAHKGNLAFNIYLELVQYLTREKDYIPIYSFITTAKEIKDRLSKTYTQARFMNYAASLLHHLYEDLGTSLLPTDSHTDTLSRIKILTWLCDFGYTKCHEETNELLTNILDKNETLSPDLQELVYCGGMRLGNLSHFLFLKEEHERHERKRILRSMACTNIDEILTYILKPVVDDDGVLKLKEEDKLDAYLAVLDRSDIGIDVVLAFTKQNVEKILQIVPDIAPDMLLALSKKLVTNAQLQQINETYDCLNDLQKVEYAQLFDTVIQNIFDNQRWQRMYLDVIDRWLAANVIPEPGTTTSSTSSSSSSSGPTSTETPSSPPGDDDDTGGATSIKVSATLLFLLITLVAFHK